MDIIDFIENYCCIKTNNGYKHIKLKKYQIELIKYLEKHKEL